MEKVNNEHDSQDNSTFMQDDLNTSFEVKESLFDKIKSALTRPRLGPGNNVKTTNMSFNSWNIRATFRRAFEAVSNGMSNMMKKKEPEVKNGFSTVVIGNDEKTVTKDLNVNEKEATQNIFIPGKIPGLQTTAKSNNIAKPDLLVGNIPSQNSTDEKDYDTLKVETMDVDKDSLLKETDNEKHQAKDVQTDNKKVPSKNEQPSIKPEVINTGKTQQNKISNKDTEQDRGF